MCSKKESDGVTFVPMKQNVKKIFTEAQEEHLAKYAIKIAKMFCGQGRTGHMGIWAMSGWLARKQADGLHKIILKIGLRTVCAGFMDMDARAGFETQSAPAAQ